jgi:hypothetical protein
MPTRAGARLAPFLVYVGVFHLAWIAWPFVVYPRLIALGERTLWYALLNISIRILVWVVPVFLYLRHVDHVEPLAYLKLTDGFRRAVAVAAIVTAFNFLDTWRGLVCHIHPPRTSHGIVCWGRRSWSIHRRDPVTAGSCFRNSQTSWAFLGPGSSRPCCSSLCICPGGWHSGSSHGTPRHLFFVFAVLMALLSSIRNHCGVDPHTQRQRLPVGRRVRALNGWGYRRRRDRAPFVSMRRPEAERQCGTHATQAGRSQVGP